MVTRRPFEELLIAEDGSKQERKSYFLGLRLLTLCYPSYLKTALIYKQKCYLEDVPTEKRKYGGCRVLYSVVIIKHLICELTVSYSLSSPYLFP